MTNELGPIPVKRRRGSDPIHRSRESLGASLQNFWEWSGSDLLGNTQRGILAEFLVALDLGVTDGARDGWDAYDLRTPEGTKVEVKSAAYVQSWYQRDYSKLRFSIAPTYAWDPKTDTFEKTKRRQADVYVFCVLAHKDQASIDPLDVNQWVFHVISTTNLNRAVGPRKTIDLTKLVALGAAKVKFGEIHAAISYAPQFPTAQRSATPSTS